MNGAEVPAHVESAYTIHDFDNGVKCVLARSTSDPIGLLQHVLAKANGPVALLYVLLLSRRGRNEHGRYQSPYVSAEEAAAFLQQFGEFLQGDGRHELWLYCPDCFQVVYDHHERIWIYGDVDAVVGWIKELGLPKGQVEPPSFPHSHHYHDRFDHMEDEVVAYWDWTRTDLSENDGE